MMASGCKARSVCGTNVPASWGEPRAIGIAADLDKRQDQELRALPEILSFLT